MAKRNTKPKTPTTPVQSPEKSWYLRIKEWLLKFWKNILIVGGFILATLSYFSDVPAGFQNLKQYAKDYLNDKDSTIYMPFPKKFQKDSLYVLVTRFEDYTSKKETECFGRSLVSRMDVIINQKKLPVRYYYIDKLAPKSKQDAKNIQRQYNADLVFWGSIKNIEKDCGAGDFCFKSEPSDTLIHLAGGDTSPQKLDVNYEIGVSPSDIEQKGFHVNQKWFDSWLLDIYNIKIGRFNPDLFIVDETLSMKDKAQINFEKGLFYFSLKKYQKALICFNFFVKENPKSFEGYHNLGSMKSMSKDYRGAIVDFSKAITINSKEAETYESRGTCKWKLNDYKGAKNDYSRAIEINSKMSSAFHNRGTTEIKLKNYEKAVHDFTEAIILSPQRADSFCYRGMSKAGLRNYDGAIDDFSKSIQKDSKNAVTYYERGSSWYFIKNYQKAIEDYSKAIELSPKYTNVYISRGGIKAELKDHKGAIEDFSKAIILNKNDADTYFSRGKAEFAINDFESAKNDYFKALELDSSKAHLYYCYIGNIEGYMKNYESSKSYLSKAILLSPDTSYYYNLRGQSNQFLKEYKAALLDFSKAIQLNPKDSVAYIRISHIKDIQKDYYGAIENYSKAIKKFPKNCVFYHNRGEIKMKLGLKVEANKDFLKAEQLGYIDEKNVQWYYPFISYLFVFLLIYMFENEIINFSKRIFKSQLF
jgi:tetratricopeptide (TPR) repeat protein